MTDAPRYRLVGYDIGTAPDENGGWVHWTDHKAIVARLTAERDYDRKQSEHKSSVIDKLNSTIASAAEKAEAERDAADQRAGALLARVAALDADCMAARQAAAENYARAEKAEARVAKLSDALAEIATAKVDALRQPPHSARNPPWEDADPVVDAEEAWALQETARDALKEMENGQ